MPMVIPLVAAFAAGAGGVAALGAAAAIGGVAGTVATIAAYATIAGAVLTGVGAITGSKDLMKIGAILSIGGGITGLAAGAAAGGAATGGSAFDVGAADGAAAADGGAMAGASAANASAAAGQFVDPTGGLDTGTNYAYTPTVGSGAGVTPPGAIPAPGAPAAPAAVTQPGAIQQPTVASPSSTAFDVGAADGAVPADGGIMSRVAQGAKQFDAGDLNSWWQKAQSAGGAVGDFIKNNPALVKVGGDMLSSMYGPQAEQFDMQKSIYERQMRNINTPIKLTYTRTGGG